MPKCDVCGEEFPEEQLTRCYDCGKAYCPGCAGKDPTIKDLGVCPNCERSMRAEGRWGLGIGRGVIDFAVDIALML